MGLTHAVRTRLGVLLVALTACALLVASAPTAHAITRSAAESKALRALDVRAGDDAVIVFGQREPIPAGAVVTEAGDAMAHSGNKAGLRSIDAPVVLRNGDEPAYLFHEDRGPYQAFEHPGRVVLVEKDSGDVRVSRELRWVPMVGGVVLPWFTTAGSYEKDGFRVFERGVGAIGRSLRNARAKARKAQANAVQLESRRRVANALAAERSCSLRVSDTLGNFFDYAGVDRSRARLGSLVEQMERMNAGFRSQRYSASSGRTPTDELERMIERSGCKDVLFYLAGSGYGSGTPAVNVGTAPRGATGVRLQDVSVTQIERVMAAHRDVTFKIVIDAPHGSRVAERLRDESNLAVMMSAGSSGEPSYAFLPNVIAGGQVVRNTLNPTQLLEFTNRLVRGMEAFVDSPLEVDFALGEIGAGRAPSMMVWMLSRGLALGTVGAPALPTTPLVILGGGFQRPVGPPFTPPGPPPVIPPGQAKKNTAPVADDSTVSVIEDTPTTVPLPATDADGDALTWAIEGEPEDGSLSGSGGSRVYTPNENFTGEDRLVYRVTDSAGASDTATVTLDITAVDDDAEILTSPGTVPYTENDSPVVVDDEVDITDVDTPNLTSATVAVTGGHAGTQDRLSFDEVLDLSSITGEFDEDSGVLVLSGTATVAEYQAALRTVRYANTSDAPSMAARTITFAAAGGSDSRGIALAEVNDAPVNGVPGAQVVEEDAVLVFAPGNANLVSIGDVDARSGAVEVTLDVDHGALSLGGTDGLTFTAGDGTGDAAMTFTGTVAAINAALNGLGYLADTNYQGADTLTIATDDKGNTGAGGPKSDTDTVGITVGPVNDAPVNTVPGAQTLDEDTTKSLAGASAPSTADSDAGGDDLQVKLDVDHGVVSLDGTTGLVFTRGDGTGDAGSTFTGTISAINAALDGLVYSPAADYTGADTLTIVTDDQGNNGNGGAKSDTDTVAFTVDAVNDAPVNTVPGAQTVDEDATKSISPSIADVDDAGDALEIDLDVDHGTFTLGAVSGLTFTSGDGTADSAMTFTGTESAINTALTGLVYSPAADYNGADTFTIVTDDQGNNGSGGAKTDTDTVAFTVSAVNDAPVNSVPPAQTLDEDGTELLSSASAPSVADRDADGDDLEVDLDVAHGTFDLGGVTGLVFTRGDGTDNAGMTFTGTIAEINAALDGLVYSPDADFNGADTLTIVTDDQGNNGSGGAKTDTDTVAFTVSAVNDAPVNTVPGAQTVDEDTPKTLTDAFSVADVDAASGTITTTLSAPNSAITVGGTGGTVTGNGTAAVTIAGTLTQVNARLASVTYQAETNVNGTRTLTMNTSDGGNTGSGGSKTDNGDTVTFSNDAVNDAPVNTVPAGQSVDEDTPKTLTDAFSVADVDAASGTVTTTLSAPNSAITVGGTGGTVTGNGTSSVQIAGTLAQVNARLASVTYQADQDVNGTRTLTMNTSDGGSTGSGGAKTDDGDTVLFTIAAVNDAPVNSVPGFTQNVNEDGSRTLAASSMMSVSDLDAESGDVEVDLDVLHGKLTLSSTTGVTFSRGDGTADAGMTFKGTLAAVRSAIQNGVVYAPDANYNGADTLTIVTDDLGNTGSGGAKTDTDTVTFAVAAVNDAPVSHVPATQSTVENANLTLSGTSAPSVSDVDAGASAVQATITAAGHGTLSTDGVSGLTFTTGDGTDDTTATFTGTMTAINAALDGMVFKPGSGQTGDATITLAVNDQGHTGSGGALTDSESFTVDISPLNKPPVNAVPSAVSVDEDAVHAFTTAGVSDPDAGTDPLETTLDVTNGTVTLDGALTGLTFSRGDGTSDAGMTFSGSQSAIDAALSGMTYAPTANYAGPATLQLATSDLGNNGEGGAKTDSDTVNITVSAVNDAPVNTLPPAQTISEDNTLALSSGGSNAITVSDVDAASGTVTTTLSVLNGTLTAALPSGGSRSGNGTASLQLTGTISAINGALNDLVYAPAANYNGSDRIRVVTSDGGSTGSGGAKSDTDDLGITVNAVNDAPVLTVPGAQSVNEDTNLVFDDARTISVADDGSPAQRVTLSVGSGTLTLGTTSGLTFPAGANGTGAMTFEGTLAQVNAALAGLTYRDATDASGSRTLSVGVSDLGNTGTGGALTDSETVGITVSPVNDAPAIALNGATPSFTEQGSAVTVDDDITITDVDDANIESARVAVTTNAITASDALTFTPAHGITDSDTAAHVLELAGTATKAQWESVLETVRFANSETVEPGDDRTVTFKVNDGDTDSATANKTVTIVDTPDGPIITPTNGSTDYTEDASPPTTVDDGITVAAGADSLIDSGTVKVTSGFQNGDDFDWTDSALITGAFDSTSGVLTFTTSGAEAGDAEWQSVLRSVKFSTANNTPVASKTVEFKLDDGTNESNAPTKEIAVTETNDAPVVLSGGTLAYTENDPATAVHPGLTVTEVEGENLSGGSASITSDYAAGQDALEWTDNDVDDNITQDSVNSNAHTVVLTGMDSAASYQAALRAVTYRNGSENPTASNRTVTFSATDVPGLTGSDTRAISVTAVDDPPTAVDDSATVDEDVPSTTIGVLANDTDIDGGPMTISSATDPANGTTAVVGNTLRYRPDADYCGPDSFTYTLNGGDTATVSMTVTCVNDAPVADTDTYDGALGNTRLTVSQSTSGPHVPLTGDVISGDNDGAGDPEDSDVDSPTSQLEVVPETVATTNNGSLTINADGQFTYDPPQGFLGDDTFTYTLTDKDPSDPKTDTATVTIDVAGPLVWYVDSDAAAPDANEGGRSHEPFTSLAALTTSGSADAKDGSGDRIFVYRDNEGTPYSGGFVLESTQQLLGETHGLAVTHSETGAAHTLVTPDGTPTTGENPTIDGGVLLNANNTLQGMNLGSGTAASLSGVNVGTATVNTTTPGTINNTNGGGAVDINTGNLNMAFASISTSGAVAQRSGIKIQNATGTFTGSGGTLTDAFNSSSEADVRLVNGSLTFTYDGAINDDGGRLVEITGQTGGVKDFNGSITDGNDGDGTGIRLANNSGGSIRFDGATTLSTGANPALAIVGTSDLAMPVTSGSITTTSGIGVDINTAGSGTIAIGAPITTGTGSPVSVVNRNGGSVTFSNSIQDTGSSGGIVLTNNTGGTSLVFSGSTKEIDTNGPAALASTGNTGTVRFSGGGLDLHNANGRSFQATGGGSIEVSGSGNVLDSDAGGSALEVSGGTTIADTSGSADDSGLRFQRIDSVGGTNGVLVDGTGQAAAGRLTVTGSGGTCTAADTTGCTGGTVATASGAGIKLNQTRAANLNRVLVRNAGGDGIDATTMDGGLTLADSVVRDNGGANVGGTRVDEDRGLDFLNVAGTVNILRTAVQNSTDTNAHLDYTALPAATVNVTDSSFSGARNGGFHFGGEGNSTLNATVTGSTFTTSDDPGFRMHSNAGNTTRQTLKFENNDVSGGSSTAVPARPQISINSDGGLTSTSIVKVTINNNDIKSSAGNEITLNTLANATSGATFDATVTNNDIGDAQPGALDPLADGGVGIHGWAHGDGVARMTIANNTIRNFGGKAMELGHNDGVGSADYTVSGNVMDTPDGGPNHFEGIYAYAGGASGDSSDVCIDMDNNDMDDSGPAGGSDLTMDRFNGNDLRFAGFNGSDVPSLETYLRSANPLSPNLEIESYSGGPTPTGATTCAAPQGTP